MSTSKFIKNWVLIDELAVGSAPHRIENLIELDKLGIKNILSLCDSDEFNLPIKWATRFNWNRYVLPDHKSNEKLSGKTIIHALDIIKSLIDNGPVYVHCFAGVERSPIICMGWMIKYKNLSQRQALDYLSNVHSITNPLPDQYKALKEI